MVRPERFELPAYWFEASCSIRLSYGRTRPSSYHQEVSGAVETEVKLRCSCSASEAGDLLRSQGYAPISERTHEADQLFDLSDQSMRSSDRILRLRKESNASSTVWTLTYKGPAERGRYKTREELETEAAHGEVLQLILHRLGYLPGFRYEKYRTKFRRGTEPGIVTLDETPAGVFLELEGPKDWIDSTALRLGYSQEDYVISSYAVLWREYRSARQGVPEDMVFESK